MMLIGGIISIAIGFGIVYGMLAFTPIVWHVESLTILGIAALVIVCCLILIASGIIMVRKGLKRK